MTTNPAIVMAGLSAKRESTIESEYCALSGQLPRDPAKYSFDKFRTGAGANPPPSESPCLNVLTALRFGNIITADNLIIGNVL
ncbi:MAG TPA: hypothetical protein DD726_00370 [Phycisphaerales bacterium]|nr:hypothetical protein [Phycisphaerales bacterium]